MLNNLSLEVNSIYNFTTIAPGVISLVFKNAKLTGAINYDAAIKISNVTPLWDSIYPLLVNDGKENYPNDPSAYQYYSFMKEDGTEIALAGVWINPNSIQLVESINMTISLYNLATLDDVTNIVKILRKAGYTDFTTKVN